MKAAASVLRTALLSLLLCALTACSQPPPASPASLSATLTEAQSIQVMWDPSPEAEIYRLFRKTDDAADYKFLCDLTSVEYTDMNVSAGCSYRYMVRSLSGSGTSEGTESQPVTVPAVQESNAAEALTAPVITSVTRMDRYTNVVLFEHANDGCEYEVLRGDTADGEFASLGMTNEPAFYDVSDEAGNWFYVVRAARGEQQSPLSAPTAVGANTKGAIAVPVFMYHEFVTQEDLDGGVVFDEYAIWQEEFEADLIWLRDNGYTTITTQQLADWLNGTGTLPEKPVILTIDDGKLGVYKRAWPLLREYDMVASLAVIGANIEAATQNPEDRSSDSAPYCTWEEIGEMSASGHVEIISHTYSLHIYDHGSGRQGANCAEGETAADFFSSAQMDYIMLQNRLAQAGCPAAVAQAYPYSIRSQAADRAWLQCGYQILLGGNSASARRTHMNFYVQEAGINLNSALTRRLVRMTGTPISIYMEEAIAHDTD